MLSLFLTATVYAGYPSFWVPESSFNTSIIPSFAGPETGVMTGPDLKKAAVDWANSNLQMTPSDKVEVSNGYLDATTGLYHCYMVKVSQGLPIVNALAHVTMDRSGNLISNGNSWVPTSDDVLLAKRDSKLSCSDSLTVIASHLGEAINPAQWNIVSNGTQTIISNVNFTSGPVKCDEKLYQTVDNLNHVTEISVPTEFQYVNAMIDQHSGKILGVADWTSHLDFEDNGDLSSRHVKRNVATKAEFKAIQLGGLDPDTSSPALISDPIDFSSSPNGWNDKSSTTKGNNVIATDNADNLRKASQIANNGKEAKGTNFVFDFEADDTNQDPTQYTDAATTNAFFLANRFHDIMFQYGFDGPAGNFQQDNFGKGGRDKDPVLALVHDGSGLNNANFASPPDGNPGIMRMFIFTKTTPRRDGALENAVVLHELTHGVTARLTGGPSSANCLSKAQSAGLGEGWSDMVAILLEMEAVDTIDTPKVIGQYVSGNTERGVRNFPYSTDTQISPNLYSAAQKTTEVHAVGEIWGIMLFEVYWNMVTKAGFDGTFRTNPTGKNGNNKFLRTLIAAMKIQPCFPTFVTAKDAIITADKALNQGAFRCEIIKGFAKRGLGINAIDDGKFVDNFDVPADCK